LSDSATGCLGDAPALYVLSSRLSERETDAGSDVAAAVPVDLLDHLIPIPDWRDQRWVEHPLAAVLALCAAAVVAGMRSFAAIASWVREVPADVVASMYARCGHTGVVEGPSKCTLWRVLTGTPGAALDAAIGAWLLRRTARSHQPAGSDVGRQEDLVAVAVDGKAVRGAVSADGAQVHLLAAMTHARGLVVGQTDVAAKTNEIPMFTELLDGLDLTNTIITADALHTQRAAATYLHRRGSFFVFTVKENQPRLFDALDALPWTTIPIQHTITERAHGRITTRAIQTMPAPKDLPFPHVEQVWLIERGVTDLHGKSLSNVAALGITNLAPAQADPARVAELVRDHWGIESLHWIRDTLYREDDSTAHTGSGPRTMATLRNLAIGAIRLLSEIEQLNDSSAVLQDPDRGVSRRGRPGRRGRAGGPRPRRTAPVWRRSS